MKLALSSRLWETPRGYAVNQTEHLRLSAELGYQGVELRYPLLPICETGVAVIGDELHRLCLTAVFGPCAGIPKDAAGWEDAARVMDTLQKLGARWVKRIPIRPEDETAMARLADMAASRGLKLCTQIHANTLTDTVASAERFLRAVASSAVGLIFDAAHLQLARDPDVRGAIHRLKSWLQLVNAQCLARVEATQAWVPVMPGEPGATDLTTVVDALREVDYDGWITVMPAVPDDRNPTTVARAYWEWFVTVIGERRSS